MTRIEIAEKALAGIFEVERATGRDAGHLTTALRMVVGAWIGHGFTGVLNDLEVARHADGFEILYQHHLNSLKARGASHMPDARIERMREEQQAQYAEHERQEQAFQARRQHRPLVMDEVRRG